MSAPASRVDRATRGGRFAAGLPAPVGRDEARLRAFAVARTHSRLVRFLRVAAPVGLIVGVAALIVGAPAVGGALFLVDRLIGDRVSRFASVHYRVEGPWKEPRITFVKPFEKSR